MDCETCKQSPQRLCSGIVTIDPAGRSSRCDRLRLDQAEEMLPDAHLSELITTPTPGVDPADRIIHVSGSDVVASFNTLAWLVSVHLLEGVQAVFYHCPAWAGRGWDLIRADHMSPMLVAYAFPEAVQANREYRDSLAQVILGRVTDDRKVAIATIGEWEPETPIEALLIAELRRGRGGNGSQARGTGKDPVGGAASGS